jgi:hypothetical protein
MDYIGTNTLNISNTGTIYWSTLLASELEE